MFVCLFVQADFILIFDFSWPDWDSMKASDGDGISYFPVGVMKSKYKTVFMPLPNAWFCFQFQFHETEELS